MSHNFQLRIHSSYYVFDVLLVFLWKYIHGIQIRCIYNSLASQDVSVAIFKHEKNLQNAWVVRSNFAVKLFTKYSGVKIGIY